MPSGLPGPCPGPQWVSVTPGQPAPASQTRIRADAWGSKEPKQRQEAGAGLWAQDHCAERGRRRCRPPTPESQSTPSALSAEPRAQVPPAGTRSEGREGLESPPTPGPAPEFPGAPRCQEKSSARGCRERLPAARRDGPYRPPYVTYDPHLLPRASEPPRRSRGPAPLAALGAQPSGSLLPGIRL